MNNLAKQKSISKILELYQDEDYVKAKKEALKLLSKKVKNTAVYNILGLIYMQEYNLSDAKLMYEKALQIDDNTYQLYLNLANVYLEENSYIKAEKLYLKAISLGSNTYLVYYNLAKLYVEIHDKNKAEKMFHKALSLNPDNSDIRLEYSKFCFRYDRYLEGFEFYRSRYEKNKTDKNTFLVSNYNLLEQGDNLHNKKLLLTDEQASGDIIEFIRYLPMFEHLGAKVYVQTKKILLSLFKKSYPNITFLHQDEIIDFDYHLPIMDAAYFFKTKYETIPYQDKYINVDKNDSKKIYDKYFKGVRNKKIGIVWRSNVNKKDNYKTQLARAERNCELEDFLKYFNCSEVQLYSLQVDVTQKEKEILHKHDILSLGDYFIEIYDNALVIDNLDAVIGIETLSAVVAASMGKETVFLLRYNTNCMWGESSSTNWHSSIKIVRRKENTTWKSVFQEIVTIDGLLSNTKPIYRMMQIAIKFQQQGYLIEAEQLYREILKEEPNHADAYHYLGVIAFNYGHIEQSIALIKEAIKLNPELDEAYTNLKLIAQSLH